MIKCSVCGRDFKSPQALGGHMRGGHKKETQEETSSSNHSGNPEEVANTVETNEAESGETVLGPEEASKAEQIRTYLKQGYTVKQLITSFNFSETTVRQEMAKLIPPEGEVIDEKGKEGNVWPVTRKTGGGQEVITPEAVLIRYMDGDEQEQQELKGMMKLRAAMLMVMDLVNIQKTSADAEARRLEPILRLMRETREEQDAAAVRAKASSFEMAREAAQDAVSGVLGYIEQKIPQVPPPKTVDEAYAKRIDKVMDMMWNVMEQQMFPQRPLDGWETESVKQQGAASQPTEQAAETQNPLPQGNTDGGEQEEHKEAE